jgi:DNA-binding NtrC family response regulator
MTAPLGRVLVVDDDATLLKMLEQTLARAGYLVSTAAAAEYGLAQLDEASPDIVVTDLKLPAMDGIEFLRRVRAQRPGCEVIVMTGYATLERAVEAMRLGAYDFVEKPIDRERLLRTVAKALEKHSLQAENTRLRAKLDERQGLARLVGASHAMDALRELIQRVARADAPVLITGASGTGKEVVADVIHALSARASGTLVKISCAAIPDPLLESELFGYEKGAFSGAVRAKPGRFELADKGTLFLDEIGEMPGAMQAKLLRVLQDGTVQRLGSTHDIHVDARVITATNVDIGRALAEGRFREDLYHRLSVFEIHVPHLAEHPEDIPALVAYFLARYGSRRQVPIERVSPEAMTALLRHPWRGNVRELENVVQRAVAMAAGPVLEETDVHLATYAGRPPEPARSDGPGIVIPLGTKMKDAEDLLIEDAIRRAGGNRERAAQLLGVSSRTLTRRARRTGESARTEGA